MDSLLCPYCGRTLEEGTLQSRGANYFLPVGQKPPLLYTRQSLEKRGAIPLPPNPFSPQPPGWPAACACRNCRMIMLPYGNPPDIRKA